MRQSALNNIFIVLVGPKHPGNLGSVARAMHNMGFGRLRLVAPRCRIDEDAYRLAKAGSGVLHSARSYRSTSSALRGMHLVIGTTAKTGGNREKTFSPRALAPRILAHAVRQKAAILFGPEDTGLVDDDLLRCQLLIRIPTSSGSRSINLSHAVMLLCYELLLAGLERPPERVPRLAPAGQIEAMYDQLERSLLEIGFLTPKTARHMMFALRRLLGRTGLETTEVAMLRGIARQISWYGRAGLRAE
jgi:tRNA/rRNA methyltransferase